MTRVLRRTVVTLCLGIGGPAAAQSTVPLPPPNPLPSTPPATTLPGVATVGEPLSFRDVVKRVAPAVVSIEAKLDPNKVGAARPRTMAPLPPGIPEEYRRFFEPPGDPDPRAEPSLGFGSGVLIDPAGVVLTNYHVVEGADSVEVTLPDGRKFTSKDVRRDPKTDLAVVKVTADKPLPFLDLGDSDAMEVGDRVLAVGAPFGLTGTVTHGIVSAKSRQGLKLNQYEDFLQTDAAINPGNSGGPLVNLAGQVVGVSAAIKTKTGGFQGVGLAVSSNLARDVAKQLTTTGTVRRGYLGVSVRPIDDELAARLAVPKGTGVVVNKVSANSPAAKAGIQVGDVVTALAGQAVTDANLLPRAIAKLPVGQPADLLYVRDGKTIGVKATIEEQPADYGAVATAAPLRGVPVVVDGAGLTVADLAAETAAQYGYPPAAKGAIITAVDPAGRAAKAGLIRGMVVVKVDRTPVASAKEFADAVAAASPDRGALIHVFRPTGEVDFAVLRLK